MQGAGQQALNKRGVPFPGTRCRIAKARQHNQKPQPFGCHGPVGRLADRRAPRRPARLPCLAPLRFAFPALKPAEPFKALSAAAVADALTAAAVEQVRGHPYPFACADVHAVTLCEVPAGTVAK